MSGTFPCPHCGAQYPRKPVLVGKTVRCTTCKNAFVLRESGVADKVQPAAPPAPAPAAPSSALAPIPAATRSAAPAAAIPTHAASPSTAPTPTPTVTPSQRLAALPSRKALSQKAEATRRAMAATLTDAMSGALAAESVKREDERRIAEEKRRARQAEAAAPGEGGQGKIKPAVLTGEGEREALASRHNWLIALALVLVVGGAIWFMLHLSPPQRALADFTAPLPNRPIGGLRVRQIQERALLLSRGPGGGGVTPFIELPRPRFGPLRVIDGARFAAPLARITGATYFAEQGVWTAPSDRDLYLKVMASVRDPAKQFADAAARAKLKYIPHRDLEAAWKEAGVDAEATGILTALLIGETSPGANDIVMHLSSGKVPTRIEWLPLTGAKGSYLIDLGNQTRTKVTPYHGKLIRMVGEGWPGVWKVYELAADSVTPVR